jgi:hypothetical protein
VVRIMEMLSFLCGDVELMRVDNVVPTFLNLLIPAVATDVPHTHQLAGRRRGGGRGSSFYVQSTYPPKLSKSWPSTFLISHQ